MQRNHKIWAIFAISLMLSGCAHEVRIAPEISKIDRPFGAPTRLPNTVGYYVSDEQLSLSVVTPAGGGDSVKYSPYRDFVDGLKRVLENVYEKVTQVRNLNEIEKGVELLVLPKISTNSSSTSLAFWPPERFTVGLQAFIKKPTGEAVDEISVNGEGSARMGFGSMDHAYGRSIAGERAMLDALTKLQAELLSNTSGSSRKKPNITSSGSGFFVAPNLVVTNQHVVNNCERISVRRGSEISAATVQQQTRKADLALLVTTARSDTVAKLRKAPLLGEEIIVSGHPLSGILSSNLIVSAGNVNSLAGMGDDPTLIQISAPVQPGNSGGPILDKSGNVIGVVVSKLNVMNIAKLTGDVPQNVNFGVKGQILRLFLDNASVQYESGELKGDLPSHSIAAAAKSITVQILCNPSVDSEKRVHPPK